jgi:GNAT superfamily N-acetyltransferase
MGALTVSRATEAEAAACLALMPEAANDHTELLVARRDGALAGAAAVIWQSWSQPAGFPLKIHVLPHARRRGVGRTLCDAAKALIAGETTGLWALEPVEPETAEAAFMEACGFAVARRERFFQASTAALKARIAPLAEKLAASGRAPKGARVVPLKEGPMDEVGWLVAAEFGGGPFQMLSRLQARARDDRISTGDRSHVLIHEGRVCAVVLARMDHGVGVIDARVVAPGWRGDWAGAMILAHMARRAEAEGVAEFRFHCDETVLDTLKLARRTGARETATKVVYYYAASAA